MGTLADSPSPLGWPTFRSTFWATLASVGASCMAVTACTDAATTDDRREFVVTVANLTPALSVFASGQFDTPNTELHEAPIAPGQSYRFEVIVHPGAQLQLITMFLESNDAFLAFAPEGIALWDFDGQPIIGDRTDELFLYDAGTEVSQPLGLGDAQPLRQSGPNQGVGEHQPIRVIAEPSDGPVEDQDAISYPGIAEFAQLHVAHLDGARFEIVLRNVSTGDLLGGPGMGPDSVDTPALLSRGVFSVHEPGVEWFEVGAFASEPLERLIEDGEPTPLVAHIAPMMGVASAFSGVVWAIHDGETGLCAALGAGLGGSRVPGEVSASAGLESLVEDARAQDLLAELAELEHITEFGLADRSSSNPHSYTNATSVFGTHESVVLRFTASPGDHLGLISGYLATNDKFVGNCDAGIPLFSADGIPRQGSIDSGLALYDAGTEVDEPPGLGAHQFERQTATDPGIDEHAPIRELVGWWMDSHYPSADQLIDVSIVATTPG